MPPCAHSAARHHHSRYKRTRTTMTFTYICRILPPRHLPRSSSRARTVRNATTCRFCSAIPDYHNTTQRVAACTAAFCRTPRCTRTPRTATTLRCALRFTHTRRVSRTPLLPHARTCVYIPAAAARASLYATRAHAPHTARCLRTHIKKKKKKCLPVTPACATRTCAHCHCFCAARAAPQPRLPPWWLCA